MGPVDVIEVALTEVVRVTAVVDGCVPAARTMGV
jgi:hypothetical protein